MVDFVVDVQLSLTLDELRDLKQLSVKQGTSVEDVARKCMMDKCKELLLVDLFEKVEEKINPPTVLDNDKCEAKELLCFADQLDKYAACKDEPLNTKEKLFDGSVS